MLICCIKRKFAYETHCECAVVCLKCISEKIENIKIKLKFKKIYSSFEEYSYQPGTAVRVGACGSSSSSDMVSYSLSVSSVSYGCSLKAWTCEVVCCGG